MNKRRQSAPPPPPAPSPRKPLWLFGGLVALIAIALGIAVWSASGSDAKVSEGTIGTDNSSSSAAETQPVTVIGDPLPKLASPDAAIGLTPPELHGFTFDGSAIDIVPGGRAKMVVFLAHWCPHCNREIPVIQSWAAAGGVPADLDIIGVSTGVSAQRDNYPPSKWLVDKGWTWPVLADSAKSDAAVAYGLTGYPMFAIVGADGKVKVRQSGELAVENLNAVVTQALAG